MQAGMGPFITAFFAIAEILVIAAGIPRRGTGLQCIVTNLRAVAEDSIVKGTGVPGVLALLAFFTT